MQSIGGGRTSNQQRQFQEPSQSQHSRTHKLYFQGPSCVRAPKTQPASPPTIDRPATPPGLRMSDRGPHKRDFVPPKISKKPKTDLNRSSHRRAESDPE